MVKCLKEQNICFKGILFHSRFLIRHDKKLTIKVGSITQICSVSLKTVTESETKKTSDNLNKSLCFGTILSEHLIIYISES